MCEDCDRENVETKLVDKWAERYHQMRGERDMLLMKVDRLIGEKNVAEAKRNEWKDRAEALQKGELRNEMIQELEKQLLNSGRQRVETQKKLDACWQDFNDLRLESSRTKEKLAEVEKHARSLETLHANSSQNADEKREDLIATLNGQARLIIDLRKQIDKLMAGDSL